MNLDILPYAFMSILLSVVIWFDQRKCHQHNSDIGTFGENIVANHLGQLDENYTVANDIHIGHSQIDHLVINHKLQLCFVIETKYWGGVITGNRNDKYWQQNLNGSFKYLPNPIKQNDFHCREIRKSYKGYHVYSIVVFVKNKNVPHLKQIVDENVVLDYIVYISDKQRSIRIRK